MACFAAFFAFLLTSQRWPRSHFCVISMSFMSIALSGAQIISASAKPSVLERLKFAVSAAFLSTHSTLRSSLRLEHTNPALAAVRTT